MAHLLLEDILSSQTSLCPASPPYSHPSPPCQLYPSSPTEVTALTPLAPNPSSAVVHLPLCRPVRTLCNAPHHRGLLVCFVCCV